MRLQQFQSIKNLRFKTQTILVALVAWGSLVVVSTGCSAVYGVANYSSETTVLEKPSYRDSTTSATYLTGSFVHSKPDQEEVAFRSVKLGTFQIHKAGASKFSNYGIGAFVHGGSYNAIPINDLNGGEKPFIGGGITGEGNLNIPFDYLDWRIIGIKLTYLYEGGEYASFRRKAAEFDEDTFEDEFIELDAINLNPNNTSLNVSFTSEMVIKLKEADLGASVTLGLGHQFLTAGSKLYFSKNRWSVFIAQNTSLGQVSSYYNTGASIKLGK